MKISTKGRYALRMLTDLVEYQGEGYVSLNEIAERQNISKKYLEQIVPMLNKAGILRTNRGNKGGYRLNVEADKCTVGDVLFATEGALAPVACLQYEVNDCPMKEQCDTLYVWEGLQKVMQEYFDSITLKDIVDHKHNSEISNYCI